MYKLRDVLIISVPQWLTMDNTVRQPIKTLGSSTFNCIFLVGTLRTYNVSSTRVHNEASKIDLKCKRMYTLSSSVTSMAGFCQVPVLCACVAPKDKQAWTQHNESEIDYPE